MFKWIQSPIDYLCYARYSLKVSWYRHRVESVSAEIAAKINLVYGVERQQDFNEQNPEWMIQNDSIHQSRIRLRRVSGKLETLTRIKEVYARKLRR